MLSSLKKNLTWNRCVHKSQLDITILLRIGLCCEFDIFSPQKSERENPEMQCDLKIQLKLTPNLGNERFGDGFEPSADW